MTFGKLFKNHVLFADPPCSSREHLDLSYNARLLHVLVPGSVAATHSQWLRTLQSRFQIRSVGVAELLWLSPSAGPGQ